MPARTGLSRRSFLLALAGAAAGLLLAWVNRIFAPARAAAPSETQWLYLPLVTRNDYAGVRPYVVHVHDVDATDWSGESEYYNYVSQATVDDMAELGLKTLTSKPTLAEAWQALLPNYQPGKGVAIKVNFNNEGARNEDGMYRLDTCIQTVNAILRGMTQFGVQPQDIWIYDAWKNIPARFCQMCLYPGVQFYDRGGTGHIVAGYSSSDPTAWISFSPPAGIPLPPTIKVTDVLVRASYVVNVPLLKAHYYQAGVTLGFKHHLGSTNNPEGFHAYIFPPAAGGGAYFRTDYNPLIDLYRNANIRGKTVLTVGDGLFAGRTYDSLPLRMNIFGNQPPNSLFFSSDPVAIDSVMYDLLDLEWHLPAGSDSYLQVASLAGLGTFERGSPLGTGYTKVQYQRLEA